MIEGPGPRADAQDQGEHGQAARHLRRGAVLHLRAPHHRHRARLRPHHLGDRRGDDRLVRHGDALLRHAQGASGPPRPQRRQDRRHHLQDRRACRRSRQGTSRGARARRRAVARALRFPLAGPVQPLARSGYRLRLPRRDAAQGGPQGGALLLDVRPEVLLHAHLARGARRGRGRAGHAEMARQVPRRRRRVVRAGADGNARREAQRCRSRSSAPASRDSPARSSSPSAASACEVLERGAGLEARAARGSPAACWRPGASCESSDAADRRARRGEPRRGGASALPGTVRAARWSSPTARDLARAAAVRATHGATSRRSAREQIAALEPELAERFGAALYFADEGAPRSARRARGAGRAAAHARRERSASASRSAAPAAGRARGASTAADSRRARALARSARRARARCCCCARRSSRSARPVRVLHPRTAGLRRAARGRASIMVGATMIESDDGGAHQRALACSSCCRRPTRCTRRSARPQILEIGTGVRAAFPDNLPRIRRVGERAVRQRPVPPRLPAGAGAGAPRAPRCCCTAGTFRR